MRHNEHPEVAHMGWRVLKDAPSLQALQLRESGVRRIFHLRSYEARQIQPCWPSWEAPVTDTGCLSIAAGAEAGGLADAAIRLHGDAAGRHARRNPACGNAQHPNLM